MSRLIALRLTAICCLLVGARVACVGQVYTPPPPPLTTLPPCPMAKDAREAKKIAKRKDCDPTNNADPQAAAPPASAAAAGSAAEKFPFPGEQSAKPADAPAAKAFPYPGETEGAAVPGETAHPAAKQYPYPGESGSGEPGSGVTPDVPHDAAAEKKAKETPAGKAFPYPGEHTGEHPGEAAKSTVPDAGAGADPAFDSSSSSSSSPASSSSEDAGPRKGDARGGSASDDDDDDSQPKLTDKGSEGKHNKKTVKPQTDDERVDEDLSVAKFYGESGNSMGAYLRAKDAVMTEPDFAEAHFVLGEAAKRLNKRDEAKAEFSAYLKLAPDGGRAKAAERALDELR